MTIEERLAMAERRIADLERRLGAPSEGGRTGPVLPVERTGPWGPFGPVIGGCPNGCPTNSVCGNVACPLRPVVTCGTGTPA